MRGQSELNAYSPQKKYYVHLLPHIVFYSTQHATTYIKKVIEDNSTMEETIRFLAVRMCMVVCINFKVNIQLPFVVLLLGELAILNGSHQ